MSANWDGCSNKQEGPWASKGKSRNNLQKREDKFIGTTVLLVIVIVAITKVVGIWWID